MPTDGSKTKFLVAAVTLLVSVVVVAAVWLQVGGAVEEQVRREAKSRGVGLAFEDLQVWPNGVVELHDVSLSHGTIHAEIEVVQVDGRVFSAGTLEGRPAVASVVARGVKLRHQPALEPSSGSTGATASTGSADPIAGLKRLGGGTWPRLNMHDVEFAHASVAGTVSEVELGEDGVRLREVELGGALLERFVSEPVRIAQAELKPSAAVLRRERDAIESVDVRGLEVSTTRTKLQGALPRQVREQPAEDGPEAGWNDRAHRLVNRMFVVGAGATERVRAMAPPTVTVSESTVKLADQRLVASAVAASWKRTTEALEVGADVSFDGEASGRLTVKLESSVPKITIGAQKLSLKLIGLLRPKSPFSGGVDVNVAITKQDDDFGVNGVVASRGATIKSERLAAEPVVFPDISYAFEGVFAPTFEGLGDPKLIGHPSGGVSLTRAEKRGKFEVTKGTVSAPNLSAELRFGLYGLALLPVWPARFDLHLTLPKTSAQALLDVVPPQLLGDIQGAKFGGEVEAVVDVELPLNRASRMRWKIDEQLHDFSIEHLPEPVDVRRLMKPMTARLGGADCQLDAQIPAMRSPDDGRAIHTRAPAIEAEGCSPWKYAPLDTISEYIHGGVLTTEDGAFYRHEGFNEDAIRKSLQRNIAEGRFARGASTISMQLVKNLFLSKDKHAARKLREALLVYLMERVLKVPKKRIMEVYLNVIEYGVGIYGIDAAAQTYFGKTPATLTLVEAAWIITLIPGPRARYPYFKRKKIPDEWWGRIRGFIDEMYRKERIDEFDFLAAKVQPPVFGSAGANNPEQFRSRVAATERRMRALRETGMSREALVEWSRALERQR